MATNSITGRRDSELAAAVKEIGKNATGVQCDVSNLDDAIASRGRYFGNSTF
jgi:hypothetical protein